MSYMIKKLEENIIMLKSKRKDVIVTLKKHLGIKKYIISEMGEIDSSLNYLEENFSKLDPQASKAERPALIPGLKRTMYLILPNLSTDVQQ